MRRHQMSFTIENFSKEKHDRFYGYIDANSPIEILNQLLKECHDHYYKDMSFAEFCSKVTNFDDVRFGSTDVHSVDMK